MADVSPHDIEAILDGLDQRDESIRKTAISFVASLGEIAVPAIGRLQRISGSDPSMECRYLARKVLHELSLHGAGAGLSARAPRSSGMTQVFSLAPAEVLAVKLASPDPDVRASAYRAAGLKQDKTLFAPLLSKVGTENEPDPELRAILVRVLAILGGTDSIPAVSSYLDDPDARVRSNAIEALSNFRHVVGITQIAKALQDPDHRVVAAAVTSLQSIGMINLLKVASVMMQAPEYWSRDAGAFMLAAAKIPEGVPLLEKGLSDPNKSVQLKCLAGLERLAEAGCAAAQEALQRLVAARGAKSSPENTVESPVFRHEYADEVASDDVDLRRSSTQAMSAAGFLDEGLLPAILSRMKVETDPVALANLIRAVGSSRKPVAAPVLSLYVSHGDPEVRAAVAEALATIGSEDALSDAVPLMSDPSPLVAGRAILALRAHPSVNVTSSAAALALNSGVAHRKEALSVLAKLRDRRFVPLVEMLAVDPNEEVASSAKEALKSMATSSPLEATDGEESISQVVRIATGVGRRSTTQTAIPVLRPTLSLPVLPQSRWRGRSVAAGLFLCAIVVIPWRVWRAAEAPRPRIASPSRKAPRIHALRPPSVPLTAGQAQSMTGTVVSQSGSTIILKQKYNYYMFEFSRETQLPAIAPGDMVHVEGRYYGWKESSGVYQLYGTSISRKGGQRGT